VNCLIGQIDQVRTNFDSTQSTHPYLRPKKGVQNKESHATGASAAACITVRAAGLLDGFNTHIGKPGGGNLIRLGFFPFTVLAAGRGFRQNHWEEIPVDG
jgi:hypothetical protein